MSPPFLDYLMNCSIFLLTPKFHEDTIRDKRDKSQEMPSIVEMINSG